MAKNKKIPKNAVSRKDKKDVRFGGISRELKPSWRFSTTDKNGRFAWPKGQEKESEIISKLHNFDSMKWSEIEGEDHHFLSLEKLSKDATERLSAIHKDDAADMLFSFHLNGQERIICIRENNIGKLLWYDPEHGVCPSNKKYT